MKRFKVYYATGETYMGDMVNTPIWDVLVIVQEDADHGKRLIMGGDYYIYDYQYECWIACDHLTVWQYMNRPGLYKVLIGVMAQ